MLSLPAIATIRSLYAYNRGAATTIKTTALLCSDQTHAVTKRWKSQLISDSTLPLSTSISPICVRHCSDPTAPLPPPFPLLSHRFPYDWRVKSVVKLIRTLPPILHRWPSIKQNINCPVIVDHCNLLLALAHRLPSLKKRKKILRLSLQIHREQRFEVDPNKLSQLELRGHKLIAEIINNNSLLPLPGSSPLRSKSRKIKLKDQQPHRYPRITRHQLKVISIIENYKRMKAKRQLSSSASVRWSPASNPNPPDRWFLPGHVRRLMRLRDKARKEKEEQQQQQQQRQQQIDNRNHRNPYTMMQAMYHI